MTRPAHAVPPRGVPILMYHEVTPHPDASFRKYCVTPRAFAAQMRWLAATGYTSISLDTLLDARGGMRPLPARPVVITFDDGFRDCVRYAAPLLAKFGFTATFYLVAGLVGRASRWLRQELAPELPLADWDAVRTLIETGHTCGAHTLTHPRLAQVSAAACREELVRSRETLEDFLAQPVRHLAYPFGSYDERVRATAVDAGYRSACSVQVGLFSPGDDVFALRRVPITGFDTLPDFIVRLRTARTPGELLQRRVSAALRALRRLSAARHP